MNLTITTTVAATISMMLIDRGTWSDSGVRVLEVSDSSTHWSSGGVGTFAASEHARQRIGEQLTNHRRDWWLTATHTDTGKKVRFITAAYAVSVVLLSQKKQAYSLGGSRPSPQSWTLVCSHTSYNHHSLPFNGLHHSNPYKYMDLLPGEMEGWVVPIADSLPTKWSPVNHRSGAGQGKSASQRPKS